MPSALARAGVRCDVYTRAWSPDLPAEVTVEPGVRVVHVPAGPATDLPKEALADVVDEFTDGLGPDWNVYDGPGHAGNGRRDPGAVSVDDGVLTITGSPRTPGCPG